MTAFFIEFHKQLNAAQKHIKQDVRKEIAEEFGAEYTSEDGSSILQELQALKFSSAEARKEIAAFISLIFRDIVQCRGKLADLDGLLRRHESEWTELVYGFSHLRTELPLLVHDAIIKLRTSTQTEFEHHYYAALIRKFRFLELLGIPNAPPDLKELDIAYVSIRVQIKGTINTTKSVEEVIAAAPRITLCGPAGAGKTTVLKWFALECGRANLTGRSFWTGFVPFLIPFRSRIGSPQPIPDIPDWVNATVPDLDHQPPPGWTTGVLENKRAILLLDGLDELPSDARTVVWNQLEQLLRNFPDLRYCLTSRWFPDDSGVKPSVSHSKRARALRENNAPLRSKLDVDTGAARVRDALTPRVSANWRPPSGTTSTEIQRLSPDAVDLLIDKWYQAAAVQEHQESPMRGRLKSYGESLKKRIKMRVYARMYELATTPFLCAAICLVNRDSSEELPTQRAALYDLCCEALIRRRGVGEKANDKPSYSEFRYVLSVDDLMMLHARLALDMTESPSSRDDRSSDYIIEADAHDVEGWVEESIPWLSSENARALQAKDIVNYMLVRCGLLSEPTAGRISFQHRAFQEYLSACAVPLRRKKNMLLDRASDDRWHDTITLAPGGRFAGSDFAHDLIEGLYKRGLKGRHVAIVALAGKCLEDAGPIDPELRASITTFLEIYIPPTDMQFVRIIGMAGDCVVPLLAIDRLKRTEELAVILSARSLKLIGSERAYSALEAYPPHLRNQ